MRLHRFAYYCDQIDAELEAEKKAAQKANRGRRRG